MCEIKWRSALQLWGACIGQHRCGAGRLPVEGYIRTLDGRWLPRQRSVVTCRYPKKAWLHGQVCNVFSNYVSRLAFCSLRSSVSQLSNDAVRHRAALRSVEWEQLREGSCQLLFDSGSHHFARAMQPGLGGFRPDAEI